MLTVTRLVLLATVATVSPAPRWVVPNFHDLTLKIRDRHGLMSTQVTTWYLKGPRMRIEHSADGAPADFVPFGASIEQCDLRTVIHLRLHDKTYRTFTSPERDVPQPRHVVHPPLPAKPEVVITINSVDTGERRQVGGYEAHHFKTTVTVEPGKGARSKPGSAVQDAWYLDLPGLNCHADAPPSFATMSMFLGFMSAGLSAPPAERDRMVIKRTGVEPHGLIIEQNSKQKSEGNVVINKTELLEVSDQPLDDSLFEVPADFTLAESPSNHLEQYEPGEMPPVTHPPVQ